MKNYYQILNVSEKATTNEITKAYRELSLRWHPDKNPDNKTQSLKKFNKISKAYEVLKSEEERARYDQLRHIRGQIDNLDHHSSIAGYLTYPKNAFSEKLKKSYISFYQRFTKEPLAIKKVVVKEEESYFNTLREKISVSKNNTPFLSNKKLTPSHATHDLRQFLMGDCNSSDYLSLKEQFQNEIKKLDQFSADKKPFELFLYQGMLEIICMVYEESKRPHLLSAIQNIFTYAQKNAVLVHSGYMEYFALLLQDSNFSHLVATALQQSWENNKTLSIDSLKKMFISKKDEQIKADKEGKESIYQHLVYASTQVLNHQLNKKLEPNTLREIAYNCLDYIRVLNASPIILVNSILNAAFLLQKASQLEQDAHAKMADESLMIQLCLIAIESARTHTPLIDLYVHTHCASLIQHLQFEHPYASLLLQSIKEHTLKRINFFPIFIEKNSHLDLLNNQSINMKLMRDYVQQMVRYLDFNKTKLANEEIQLAQNNLDILLLAYDASLGGWYDEQFLPITERKLRLDTMEALLEKEGFSWFHISQNVDSDWIGINRDEEGWLKKNMPLPFCELATVYQSFDGIEMDYATGEMNMALKRWNANDPGYKKSFSNFDLHEMIQKGIDGAYFSLDPIDPETPYHPFQKRVFSPSSLYKTDFLNTLFFTDYLLKFFTTNAEVQGRYPYNIRSIDSLIEHLPIHLKKIIQNFHQQAHEGKRHRFWIETYGIPYAFEEQENKVRMTFGNVRMAVKKHLMKINEKGDLVDAQEANEGWNFYILTSNQIEEVRYRTRKLESPSIIIIKNTDSVHFYEEGWVSKEPLTKVFSQEQLNALRDLPTDINQKICLPSMSKEGSEKSKVIDYDFNHFIYCLTTQLTTMANKPHYFSAERVFAEEFTKHYDEFAQYFPEFERLKQLNKIAGAVYQMNMIRKQNLENKLKKEMELANSIFWNNLEKKLNSSIQSDQKTHLDKVFQMIKDEEIKELSALRTHLQNIRNQMGSFTYHSGSLEVNNWCNDIYNEIKNDLTSKGIFAQYSNKIWPEVITPKIPEMVNQLNVAGQQRKQNYRNQMHNAYIFLVNEGSITASAYGNCLDELMNNSNAEPLVQANINHSRKKGLILLQSNFKQKFPGAEAQVETAQNGNTELLAAFIANHLTKEEIASLKEQLKMAINKCTLIEANFVKMGLGKSAKDLDLSRVCQWVPASIRHERDQTKSLLVYGGVLLTPSLTLQSSISKITSSLLLASSIALAPVPAYSSFLNQNNLQWEIKKAEDFVKNVEWEKQQVKLLNPFIKVDTSKIDGTIQGLNTQINQAKSQQTTPVIHREPIPTPTPLEARGLSISSLDQKDVSLLDILKGSTGSVGYTYFPSDSKSCVIAKSEINEILAELDDSNDDEYSSMSYIFRKLTFSKRLENIQKQILERCHPPTETDLKRMKEAEKEKHILDLTPEEAIDLTKRKGSELKNFFLNFFEKRKQHLPPQEPTEQKLKRW